MRHEDSEVGGQKCACYHQKLNCPPGAVRSLQRSLSKVLIREDREVMDHHSQYLQDLPTGLLHRTASDNSLSKWKRTSSEKENSI